MAEWSFVLTDRFGVNRAFLDASDVKLTRRLNAPGELSFELDLEDEAALELGVGRRLVRAYRDETIRFNGQVYGLTKQASEGRVQVTAYDPSKTLEELYLSAAENYEGIDAGLIWTDAIAGLVTTAYEFHHLATPASSITPSVLRDRAYEVGKSVLELGQELADVDDGFYWKVEPVDTRSEAWKVDERGLAEAGRLVILYPDSGVQRPVRFEYGAGTMANLEDVSEEELRPANVAVAQAEHIRPVRVTDAESVQVYGPSGVSESFDTVKRRRTLTAHAYELLEPAPRRAYTCKPGQDAPLPFRLGGGYVYDVGDLVAFGAHLGALDAELDSARVTEYAVTIGDDGEELLDELVLEEAS